MNKDDETLRSFNARIFVKGKCYNFDSVQTHSKPINDLEINSKLLRMTISIFNFFKNLSPGNIIVNNYNYKIIIVWLLSIGIIIFFITLLWFMLFNFKLKI